MYILDCKQGGQEWKDARRAIPTSSCFSRILTSTGKLSAGWDAYMNKLLAEYIDPNVNVDDRIYTKAMKRGNELEPEARKAYEFITGNKVDEVGGLFLDEDKQTLCSPDGLITNLEMGLEIKCPNLSTHIGYVRKSVMPSQYIIQVQSGMAFSGYLSWAFMSYHPRYRELIIPVDRDTKLVRTIQKTLAYFITELNQEKAIIDKHLNQEF